MKFSQKRTCKNCLMADEPQCTVIKANDDRDSKIPGYMLPQLPKEPCFKPMTNREWASFIRTEQYLQKENLKIIRLKADESQL